LRFEPGTICLPVDPALHRGARWVVPLWGQRGLSGVLMLGEALGDEGYTQEQFEIARAQGERLLDTWAMRTLTQRLLGLQRRRMAESGVADRRFRRVIHDDVLPRVHAALLNATDAASISTLTTVHRDLAALLKELPSFSESPAGRGLFDALRDLHARELAREFDDTVWEISSEAERAGGWLGEASAEVVLYAAREAMRNAARHGRGEDGARRTLTLRVRAECAGRELVISIADDGVGLDAPRAHQPGRGNGLALHSTLMIVMGGSMSIAPGAERGVVVRLTVPAPAAH
jgi:signal transduction histidine kinase